MINYKKIYISLARVWAAICVITLHTVETYGLVSSKPYWMEANIIVGIVESAIPIFFMITGATLIDYRERYTTNEYLKKRILKVGIPLGIWFLIACVYGYFMKTDAMKFPYWFYFIMMGMYLCIPLFSAVQKELREKVFLYVVLISFVLNYFIPLCADVFDLPLRAQFPFDIGAGYLIYLLLGYLMDKKEISFRKKVIVYIFAFIGFVLKVGGTYILSLRNGVLDGTFGHYTNVPCLLISIGMFLFLKEIGNRIENNRTIKIIDCLSGYTMASYVLHQYVSCYLIRPYINDIYSLAYNLGAPILNFVICVVITYIMRKIPVLRKIVP